MHEGSEKRLRGNDEEQGKNQLFQPDYFAEKSLLNPNNLQHEENKQVSEATNPEAKRQPRSKKRLEKMSRRVNHPANFAASDSSDSNYMGIRIDYEGFYS